MVLKKWIGLHHCHMWYADKPIMKVVRNMFDKYGRKRNTRMNYYTWGAGVASVFVEGLKRAGRDLTLNKLRASLETLKEWDGSTFAPITYSSTSHKGPETCNMVKADTKNKRLVSIGWRKPLKLGQ